MARPSDHYAEPLRPTAAVKIAIDKNADKQMISFEKSTVKVVEDKVCYEGEEDEVEEKQDLDEERDASTEVRRGEGKQTLESGWTAARSTKSEDRTKEKWAKGARAGRRRGRGGGGWKDRKEKYEGVQAYSGRGRPTRKGTLSISTLVQTLRAGKRKQRTAPKENRSGKGR